MYFHVVYQLHALTMSDITVTLLQRITAWQGVNTTLKTNESKLDYIYKFHSL